MSKSIRVLTTPGEKSININVEQDFEYLEILSLKLLQSDVYTRQCSDYGVIVGRVSVNGGFGIPNTRISVFIPLDGIDEQNPVISEIYPYKSVTERNDEGYRYNLLPYAAQHVNHTPTGTFFTRNDALLEPNLIYVYDKYYKFTTTTNDSGDYMLFGVPTGSQTVFVDIDLSDIGQFSLSPKDLIRMGRATEDQVNKTTFKASPDLDSLPQIISVIRNIEVDPLWGQPDICSLGITRTDFDISKEGGVQLRPTAIFMGSIFTNNDGDSIEQTCSVPKEIGQLCRLEASSGVIKSVRQTIFPDELGRPRLEYFELENGGQIIDENGAWLVEVPMNLEYITTDEFGNRVVSLDPLVGVPTKGKYRFKVKFNQSPGLDTLIKRGNFLVPNIREYWIDSSGPGFNFGKGLNNPSLSNQHFLVFRTSYAFTNNWDDYGYTGTSTSDPLYIVGVQQIKDAVDCVDRFYEFSFNKVYTVSQLHTQYRIKQFSRHRYLGIKDILNTECDSENHKFPVNDGIMNISFLMMLFQIFMTLMYPVLFVIVILLHTISFIMTVLIYPILGYLIYITAQQAIGEFALGIAALITVIPALGLSSVHIGMGILYTLAIAGIVFIMFQIPKITKYFLNFKIPNYTYPNCDMCTCDPTTAQDDGDLKNQFTKSPSGSGTSNKIPVNPDGTNLLAPISSAGFYSCDGNIAVNELKSGVPIPAEGTVGSGVGTGSLCMSRKSLFLKSDCDAGYYWSEYGETYFDDEDDVDKTKGTGILSSALPLPEMVNLFSLKGKYFSNTTPNINFNSGIAGNIGGRGTNQIKVKFNVPHNPGDTTYHLDNVIALLVYSDSGPSFKEGKLVTFQDVKKSIDPNYTGFTENDFGTNSITGTSYFDSAIQLKPFTLNYANPLNNYPKSVEYFLSGDPKDAQYLKYPIDIEYFQVIYVKKYKDFIEETSTSLQNSFNSRYLSNSSFQYVTSRKYPYKDITDNYDCCNTGEIKKPGPSIQCCDNYDGQYVVFLVRGVDPNSSRHYNEYDISKLLGYDTWGKKVVKFQGKLNIPIQAGPSSIDHSTVNDNYDTASNGNYLFFNSFNFLPDPSTMKPFITTMPQLYSSLTTNASINNNQLYVQKLKCVSASGCDGQRCDQIDTSYASNGTIVNKNNYYVNESLDGGSSLSLEITYYREPTNHSEGLFGGSCIGHCNSNESTCSSNYNSSKYTNPINIKKSTDFNNNRIVMRSDRLPFSTTPFQPSANSYRPMHASPIFSVYLYDDEGGVEGAASAGQGFSNADDNTNPLLQSFSCDKLVPLSCYRYSTDSTGTKIVTTESESHECYGNGLGGNTKIMEKGCYVLVTSPYLSLPKDLTLVSEWRDRFVLNYAACQNVFSHVFTNNWVNGSLFMFSFVNQRVFDDKNNPSAIYCPDLVFLDTRDVVTENGTLTSYSYYYRATPYHDKKFLGSKPRTIPTGGNQKNLNFPTTIMDLGPRDLFTQESIGTDEYDGYIVDTLQNTTYKDTSTIMGLFLASRLTSKGFTNTAKGATLSAYFSRKNSFIDGDVAQLFSINSEYAVIPYNPAFYTNKFDTFINNPEGDVTIGIYFSSDTQNRDYITPKRNIYYAGGSKIDKCGLSLLPVKTQEVPFYEWNIIDNDEQVDLSIFGSQNNEWSRNPETIFSFRYQKMDRLQPSSRYFRTNASNLTQDYKSYIYSINGTTRDNQYNVNTWERNQSPIESIVTGAPFFFYFGLKKGRTSFDKFTQTWLDVETVE